MAIVLVVLDMTGSGDVMADDRRTSNALDAFIVLWAVFGAIHELICLSAPVGHAYNWGLISLSPKFLLGLATLIGALATMWSPSLTRAGVFATAWAVNEIYNLPTRANHVYLGIVVNLALVTSLLWARVRRAPGASDHEAVTRRFAPAARLSLVLVYFWAVIHKLNSDYFDPQVSCGVALYKDVVAQLPFLPTASWTHGYSIAGALLIEAAIGLLLCFRATRLGALALGIGFHGLLGEGPNPFITSFTCSLIPLFSLFLPADFWKAGRTLLSPKLTWIRRRMPWMTPSRALLLVISTAMVIALGVGILSEPAASSWRALPTAAFRQARVWRPVYVLWVAVTIGALVWVLLASRGRLAWESAREVLWPIGASAVFPLIVVLNGLTPYLGIKTAANFSMYSNLRVDELRTNHLVLPRLFRGLGYQDDVVEIVDSSDSEIRERTALKQTGWSRRDLLLPYFELRRLVSQRAQSGFWIEFRRDGELSRVAYDANPDHELFRSPSPLLGRLLLFRPVSPRGEPQPCLW